MRHKFYFGLLLICFSLNANLYAQNYGIPDFGFRQALIQKYPTCFTQQDSLITTCSYIVNDTLLDLHGSTISNLDGIQFFTSLRHLYCDNNSLSNLPPLPNSITELSIMLNNITSITSLPDSLKILKCNYNQLLNLQNLPSTLEILDCSNNLLTNLPTLPDSMKVLICSSNHLSSLPALPNSLQTLSCFTNFLSSIPALPNTLLFLDCGSNQLTNLPLLTTNLEFVSCYFNQLSYLPTLPNSLKKLYCQSNSIVLLPSLPNSMIEIDCAGNQLSNLPILPASLTSFNCSYNQLSLLPLLPAPLIELHCNNNQLTSLPFLPSSLSVLHCYENQLTSLPTLPDSITYILCYNNQLSSLPKIPGFVRDLYCGNNPITCFPEIAPRAVNSFPWNSMSIVNTNIACIPNQNQISLNLIQGSQSLPFCSPANNTCNYNFTSGYVFNDSNGNGVKDNLENGITVQVNYSGNYGAWPDSAGFFNAISDTGNIIFQVTALPYYTSSTPSSQLLHVVYGIIDTVYFGLYPIPNISDLKVDVTSYSFIRAGFNAQYKIHYENTGTTTIPNAKVKFLKPVSVANLSTIPMASAVTGDTLIWNISNLQPFQHGDILINDSVFASALMGDTAIAYTWIEPIVNDTTPINNSSLSINPIISSFDPNDKSVNPQVLLPNSTNYLEYTIRFQNTGTDTAFAVMITDTLSALLDVSSLQMINASHEYDLWVENGVAKWNFLNILLPDSNTNELASHGFVKFRIKPLPGLTVADSIPNAANIYFDYNSAVTTNTIVVNVLNTTQVNELQETELQVFPNPVQDILRIVNEQSGPLGKIELINANGKVLETKTISSSTYTWNLQHLPVGTYILKGQGWGQKVVKN